MNFSNLKRMALTAAATVAFVAPPWRPDISGAGATFPYPVYSKWADAYKKQTNIGLNYQSIGSGGGIKQIKAKTVTFGASDMPLKPEEAKESALVQFPMIIGGAVPVVNLPGVAAGTMVLDGATIASIYMGEITTWNDARIKKLNPKLTPAGHGDRPGVSLGWIRHELPVLQLPVAEQCQVQGRDRRELLGAVAGGHWREGQ